MAAKENTQEQGFIYGLTRKVMAKLNLGDGGKVDNFIGKLVKDFEKAINKNKQVLELKKMNYEEAQREFDEQLEDAREELSDAWMHIPVEKVANNDAQNNYKAEYLSRIERLEASIKGLEDAKKASTEAYEKNVKEIEETIKEARERIKTIKSL